jgi:hypothetical protein
MRIGIDARLFYHQPAGISKYTWKLANALSRIDKSNEYLIFQHRRHTDPLIRQANFRRVTLYTPTHSRLEQPLLALELKRHRLDLLHSTIWAFCTGPTSSPRTAPPITARSTGLCATPGTSSCPASTPNRT